MRTIAVSTHQAKAKEGNRMAEAKEKINKSFEEATGLVSAALKLGTIAVPIVTGINLGVPKLSQSDMAALVLVAVGVMFGIYWLRKK